MMKGRMWNHKHVTHVSITLFLFLYLGHLGHSYGASNKHKEEEPGLAPKK